MAFRILQLLQNWKMSVSRIKCGCFSPLQVFVSDEVFYFHLRDLVVVQAQLCDGGWEVWDIQNTPNITNVHGRLSTVNFITCFK